MEKIIFIDRDGVINVDLMGDYVKTRAEFAFEPGAIEALKKLRDAGYKLIVISNQAGVGDGVFTEEALWDVHQYMLDELKKNGIEIFDTEYCLCSKKDTSCECRKPKTGMFTNISKRIQFDKASTYFIGDKATDIAAGKNFALKTLFVRTGHGKIDEEKLTGPLTPDLKANNLLEGVMLLLGS